MDTSSPRDPVTTVIHAMTLLVLSWIGLTLANLEVANATPPPAATESLERRLFAVERVLAESSGPHTTRELTADSGNRDSIREYATPAAFDPSRSLRHTPGRAADGEADDARVSLPAPYSRSPSHDDRFFYDLAHGVPAKPAAENVRKFSHRLKRAGDLERRRAQQSLLLMNRQMVIERFGKPSSIDLTQTGHESWGWRDAENTLVSLIFRGDYVISVW